MMPTAEKRSDLSHILLLWRSGGHTWLLDRAGNERSVSAAPEKVIGDLCLQCGSSLEGRRESFRRLTGYRQKIPVLISERTQQILFPTLSPVQEDCIWISANDVLGVSEKPDGNSTVVFLNGIKRTVPFQARVIRRQVKRCEEYLQILDETDPEDALTDSRDLIRSLLNDMIE